VAPKRSEECIFLHELKYSKVATGENPVRWNSKDVGVVLEVRPAKKNASWLRVFTSSGVGFCQDWELKNLLSS
jgi:hypothetical protein